METVMSTYDELRKDAEGGTDPKAMIEYSAILLKDHEYGSLSKAVDLMERANKLYPENMEVKERYAHLLGMQGYSYKQAELYDAAYGIYKKCVEVIDVLKKSQHNLGNIRKLESNSCIEYGEVALMKKEKEIALKMFERTDVHMYPQAAGYIALIHQENLGKYAKGVIGDIDILEEVLKENHWKCDKHKAMAYYALSLFYANGVPGVLQSDVKYAYECILQCAKLDAYLAESEFLKYSKGLFGKIKYRN